MNLSITTCVCLCVCISLWWWFGSYHSKHACVYILITLARSGLVWIWLSISTDFQFVTITDNADDQAPLKPSSTYNVRCMYGVCARDYVCLFLAYFLSLSVWCWCWRELSRGKSIAYRRDWRFKRRHDGADSLVWAVSNDRSSKVVCVSSCFCCNSYIVERNCVFFFFKILLDKTKVKNWSFV